MEVKITRADAALLLGAVQQHSEGLVPGAFAAWLYPNVQLDDTRLALVGTMVSTFLSAAHMWRVANYGGGHRRGEKSPNWIPKPGKSAVKFSIF